MADSSTLYDIVWGLLDDIVGIDAYDGEVPAALPMGMDGRVRTYAILNSSAGGLSVSALDGGQRSLLMSFYVTCVGGDAARARECVDLVRAGLIGTVDVDGVTRVIRATEDDVPLRTDPSVWPPRHYFPLEFELYAP